MGASVEYLGHHIDAEGLHTTAEKLAAIQKAPPPRNEHELRAFLGLLNYYGKFISSLSTMIHPLNQLLQRHRPWRWSKACQCAFQSAKYALASNRVLAHYNPGLPLKLAADASSYGVGAVISHQYPDGSERPIAFASRTLMTSEKNYSQLEKEALAIIFGVKKFHQYLYGRQFMLLTDHKPLVTILGPKNMIPPLAAVRLQRWADILSAYQYVIQYKKTSDHANADGLSRLPLAKEPGEERDAQSSCFYVGQIQALPVTSEQLGIVT